MHSVLVIDGDSGVREALRFLLTREGFHPVLLADGRRACEESQIVGPSLIIGDLGMPGVNGVETCQRLRADGIDFPIVVLSEAGEESDKVRLLEAGADDYIVKPFGSRELVARLRALLRRTAPPAPRPVCFSDVEVDLERRLVRKGGDRLELTRAEFNLLAFFLRHPDRPLTRAVILSAAWGQQAPRQTRTVDIHLVRLRQKLEPVPHSPRHFLTVHGVGYRFVP